MKLAIDERIKHRLVGLAVIFSVAAILLPAILKKSTQPFDALSRVAVRLPARPSMPHVSVADENRLFKNMKVSKVNLPAPTKLSEKEISSSVKIASLKNPPLPTKEEPITVAKIVPPSVLPILPKVQVKSATQPTAATIIRPRPVKRPVRRVEAPSSILHQHAALNSRAPSFAVQVANFSNAENAKILMSKLHSKGYRAQMTRLVTRNGVSYKVVVGEASKREEMVKLQKQLYSKMQLNGFVVTVNVG